MPPALQPQIPVIHGCSLADFNDTFIEITEEMGNRTRNYYRACNLALTGKDTFTNIQYSIEPTRNRFTPPRDVTLVRDYDSVICFTNWLPINAPLYLYPVTNPTDTLTSSLHLKVPMKIHPGQVSNVFCCSSIY
jgi:hypothetical protein